MLGRPTTAQPREIVRDGDLIPDNRLAPGAQDLLEHDAIARGVAEIAWTAEAPVNIALFGAWGSGKSSVYSMIEKHLDRIAPKKVKIARYDAWKYGGRELKRNFIDSLAGELGLEEKPEFSEGLEQDQVDTRLNTMRWFTKNWGSLAFGVALAAGVAVLWVVLQALATVIFTDDAFKATAKGLITQAGTVFGLALVATLVGPKVFEGAVVTTTTLAPEGSDQFAKRFSKLVKETLKGKPERLVVFIDELDRCDPKDVVATLIDLKTFLDQDNCVFIVAADREVIELALMQVPQAKPVREDEPYYATPGAFLDKIFQHQLALPPLRSRALTKFAHDLVDDQGGIWKELRDHGQDTLDRAVFALVPVHVRSPRRVKVLLNSFATNARIAGSRSIGWLDRAHEIAVLTVLQTEFPAVADDLRRVPRLLVYLRGEEQPSSKEVRNVVARYSLDAGADTPQQKTGEDGNQNPERDDPTETAAGRLLADDDTAAGAREREVAGATLRRHLANYLAKVAAASIRDPRPDLLYLQAVGGRENLADPRLGDAIDFATDTAPGTVVAAFDGQESATLADAIPLLVTEGDNESGPGQAFAYEAACRLVERLDPDDHATVTQQVAPSIIAAATKGTLSLASLPGALLVACWDGATEVVRDVLDGIARSSVPANLLDRLTVALPHLGEDERVLLVELLVNQFDDHPKALLSALREAPIDSAIDLWVKVEDRVLEVLNDLELPEPEPQSEPVVKTTRTAAQAAAAAAAAAAPAAAEPTGAGVARLEEIVDAVGRRSDHEPLLSAVLETVQSSEAAEPLRAWVNENADQLVGTMSSSVRHAWHALLGLEQYPDAETATWSALLPDYASVTAQVDQPDEDAGEQTEGAEQYGEVLERAVTDAANELLAKLLNTFATTASGELRMLHVLVAKVASWASTPEDDVAITVARTLENTGWAGGADDDDAGQLLWDRKEALFETMVSLATGDESPLYGSFVDDLAEAPEAIRLTPFATARWCGFCERLPKGAAATLSERLDAYEPGDTERAAVLGMMMVVRGVFAGDAPPGSELVALPDSQQTTTLTDAWLALSPHPDDVRSTLATLPFAPASLRRYCDSLETDQRTSIWLALVEAGAVLGLLESAGAGGIGPAAVDHLRIQIMASTREPDRSALAERLRLGTPANDEIAAVKKSVSELATDLLEKGTAGDLRTAAELALWAGGAGYGHTQTLRQKFSDLAAKHEKALPKKTAQELSQAGLLVVPKKGFLATLLGR